jgi:hypothetical protein
MLYRCPDCDGKGYYSIQDDNGDEIQTQCDRCVHMVPVEPCVHGNYARHIDPKFPYKGGMASDAAWCDGQPKDTP